MKRSLTAALLISAVLISLCSCGGGEQGGYLTKDGLIGLADTCVKNGDRFEKLLMDETAAYFYGFAASAVGSLRLAVERILWLKGEGDDFASLSSGSAYTDWDEIAELCLASPYPYYFEGLIHEIQGEDDLARECYVSASVMPNFPDEGMSFMYLRNMTVGELYALRDELRNKEEIIYGSFRPALYGYERNEFTYMPEYLRADAIELFDSEKYAEAEVAARYAVRMNPRDAGNWLVAVTAAAYADDGYQAARWLDEGLKYFPENEQLLNLRKTFTDMTDGEGAE